MKTRVKYICPVCAGLLALLFVLSGNTLLAQSTRVKGRVTDAKTGELLPLVNVVFKGTTIGVTTDFEGAYSLETRESVSELQASFVGYGMQTVKVVKGAFNAVDFKLVPLDVDLDEVRVTPGENPAHAILRNVIKNKSRNNQDEKSSYKCSVYTKMQLDITNIKPEFKNKKLQKNFGFVFDYMDTSAITGKAFLPVMISESYSDYYYRKAPLLTREVVKASRISGIQEDATLAQFTGRLHVNVNLYDNYISIFEVRFASPLCDHGLMYYKYFLVDSVQKEGRKIYKIRFHPKGTSTPVLDGEVNIDSASWALESAKVQMAKNLNVNWVRHLVYESQYTLLPDSVWFLKRDNLFADFSIHPTDSSKITSFLGHRQVDYSDVELNRGMPKEILKMDNDVIMSQNVLRNEDSFWDTLRPYALSVREKQIYGMVDSIKNTPLYQNIYSIVNTVLFGYYDTKYIGIGPYHKLYSFNKLEGNRFQLGARTTTDWSKKIQLAGYVAYSDKDREVKGGGSVSYLFSELPTSMLTVGYKHDVLQLGAGTAAFATGSFMSSVFSRGGNDRLTPLNQWDIRYEREWRQGITNVFSGRQRSLYPSPYVLFVRPDGQIVNSIYTTELGINTRLSKNEIIVRKPFENFSLGSDYPIVGIDMAMGMKGVFKSDYEFYRLELSVAHDFEIAPLGYSEFMLSGGKIFGKVPYPLLKLHEGNTTYFYDPYAYSCMNFYEFASDLWAGLCWEHHFKGFFLGKIPLLKRLKWREVFIFKALIGTLSDRNDGSLPGTDAELIFPQGMSSVSKPYFEAGVGIENIFRIFQIDAIWRLSHRNAVPGQEIQNFAINFSLHLDF